MKIDGIYHVFGLDDKAKKIIKDAKMNGYRNEKDVDKFIKDNPTLNLTKEQAECF